MDEEQVKNLTSAMAGFTKQMEKATATLKLMGNQTNDIKDAQEEIGKQASKTFENLKKQNTLVKTMSDTVSDIATNAININSTIAAIGTTGFLAKIVTDFVKLDDRMTKVSMQMGLGQKGIAELKTSVNDLSKNFGTSYQNAVELTSTLAEKKYVDNIYEAAAGIDLFTRATGVSQAASLELTDTLSKGAGMTSKEINSMYAGMVKIQQTVGISKGGMEALTNTIKDMAENMSAFGKSADDIARNTTAATALVGALEKVGISAAESTQMISNLLDPDRIQDNILLFSQLGISIEDALTGNVDLASYGEDLQALSERIVSMGAIAGQEYAKQMGMSFKQASKIAKMDASELANLTAEAKDAGGDDPTKSLKEMEKATEGFGERMQSTMNSIEGRIRGLPAVVIAMLGLLGPSIIKKVTDFIQGLFNPKSKQFSTVTEAIGDSIGNGIEKGKDVLMGTASTLKKGFQDWFDLTPVGEFFNGPAGVNAHVDALIAKASKKTFADVFYDTSKLSLADTYNEKIEDTNISISNITKTISEMKKNNGELIFTNEEMKKIKEAPGILRNLISEKLNEEDINENLIKAANLLVDEYDNQLATQDKIKKKLEELENADGGRLINIRKINEDLQNQINLQEDFKAQLEAANTAKENYGRITTTISQLEEELAKATADNNKENADALQSQIEAQKELLKENNKNLKTSDQIAKLEEGLDKATIARKNAEKELDKLTKIETNEKRTLAKIVGGLVNKGKEFATTIANTKFGKGVIQQAKDLNDSFIKGKELAKSLGAGKKMAAVAGVASAAGTATKKIAVAGIKGIGKGIAGLAKTVGPIAIVSAIVGKLLEKVKGPIERALDQLVENFMPLVEAILPIVEDLMNLAVKDIMPPMLRALAALVKIAEVILSHTLVPILHGVANLLKFFHANKAGDSMEKFAEAAEKLVDGRLSSALFSAADAMEATSISLKEEKEGEEGAQPEAIRADNGTFTKTADAKLSADNTSTSVSSNEEKSEEEKRKEMVEDNRNNKDSKNIQSMAEKSEFTEKLYKAFTEFTEWLYKQSKDGLYDKKASAVNIG